MPIYEYQCNACGHRMDKLQKLSDAPLKDCPECSKPQLQKQISASGFRLIGGGWYETDFKASGSASGTKSPAASPAAKTDSKPAAKTDSKPAAS